MDAQTAAEWIVVGALAAWGVWYAGRAWHLWRRIGGKRLVTCPDNGQSALVHVDMALAVTSDAGSAAPPLDECSRWPDKGICDQPCLQAAHAPSSSVSAIVKAWASGRQCVACGADLVESRLTGRHIALLEPGGTTREWVDVAADRLPLALATSLPVCWNCHLAESFRRQHPELVTDRDDETVHTRRV